MKEQLSQDHEEVEHERDRAIMTQNNHWELVQRTAFDLDQMRAQNERLRARMDALERLRWRRAMRARVGDAENVQGSPRTS